MHPLSAPELLRVWEWGEAQHPIDKALALLAAACPEKTQDELATLSVGQRDALLLTLWELTFGPRLDCFAECPCCREKLEFTTNVADLCSTHADEAVEPERVLAVEGCEVRFRLPNSLDLAAIARCDEVSMARDLLVRRCVLGIHQKGSEVTTGAVSETMIAALAAHLIACDPLAEVRFDLHCVECSHCWPVILDIVSFLWAEISTQAKRLMGEIHVLARAYGWREPDILALSPRRRQIYLEMVT